MHIPPSFTWHTVVHEYAHTAQEAIGDTAYKTIKWLDEGLSEYLAYTVLMATPGKENEVIWSSSRLNIAKTALAQGRLLPLSGISTETQWGSRSGADYDLQYAESYAIVSYLSSRFSPGKLLDVLRFMKAGDTQEAAIQKALGISLSALETDFRTWLGTQ